MEIKKNLSEHNQVNEKDFVEIDFTGRVKDGEIFDSTIEEDLKKIQHTHDVKAEPFILCQGQGMILKGLDEFLIGKEIGKLYEIEISPENAFGKREQFLVQQIPIKVFKEKNINPVQGSYFNFDGRIGKVIAVSGGRIVVDFNHYLAGKVVVYKVKILRKVDDIKEKIRALNKFFLRKDFNFEVKNNQIIIEVEKPYDRLAELFKYKYKEIIDYELKIKEKSNEDKK